MPAGGTGAGKSTAAMRLAETFPNRILLLSLDDYYLDRSGIPFLERQQINFDHPDAIEWQMLSSHIEMLLAGMPVVVPRYNFQSHTRVRDGRRAQPRDVLILEGNLAIYNALLSKMMDLRLYVEADADVRVLRRVQRDIQERARTLDSAVRQYLSSVKPMHETFVEPTKRKADLIIPGDGDWAALDVVEQRLSSHLEVT